MEGITVCDDRFLRDILYPFSADPSSFSIEEGISSAEISELAERILKKVSSQFEGLKSELGELPSYGPVLTPWHVCRSIDFLLEEGSICVWMITTTKDLVPLPSHFARTYHQVHAIVRLVESEISAARTLASSSDSPPNFPPEVLGAADNAMAVFRYREAIFEKLRTLAGYESCCPSHLLDCYKSTANEVKAIHLKVSACVIASIALAAKVRTCYDESTCRKIEDMTVESRRDWERIVSLLD